jgi:hypothetical protein
VAARFYLKKKIMREFGLNCFDPPNGVAVHIDPRPSIAIAIAQDLLDAAASDAAGAQREKRRTQWC